MILFKYETVSYESKKDWLTEIPITLSVQSVKYTIPVHTKCTEIKDCDSHWCLLYKGKEFAKKLPKFRISKRPLLSQELKER